MPQHPLDPHEGHPAESSSDTVDVTEGTPEQASEASRSFTQRHPFVVYTALRFGLLLIAAAICYVLGARGILLILLAFLISAIASFVLLVPQRDAVGQRTGAYFRRLNDRIEESKRAEDDIVDQAAGDQPSTEESAAGHGSTDSPSVQPPSTK